MSDLPASVSIVELGPREGFQIEPMIVPTPRKLELIDALAETGLATIEVASFVNPKLVPTMADAEQLVASLHRRPGVKYTALWLNDRGLRRALATGRLDINGSVSLSASNEFVVRNVGRTMDQDLAAQGELIGTFQSHGIKVESAAVGAAFGCNFAGDVPVSAVIERCKSLVELAATHGETIKHLQFADTMSWATPASIKRVVGAVRECFPDARISLHLHNTRGLAIANAFAALDMGVAEFDASIAGLGGCPFAGHKGAAGNVCTEDLVFMCEEMGIATGIDLESLIEAALLAERIVGHPLPGSVMKGGSLSALRANLSNRIA